MLLKKIFIIFLLPLMITSSASAEDECFEKTSRAIFNFNMGFDKAVFKPIAKAYNKLPEPIKNGTGNFTSNIATLLSVPNHILQGNMKGAGNATASFLINSSVGILGIANPAAKMGFVAQKEDVGQTLGAYGFNAGCYFVLPILGPTTARDSIGMIIDSYLDPFSQITWREGELFGVSGNKFDYVGYRGASAIDFRGDNMQNFESLEKNSLDMYSSLKSVYLQGRKNNVTNSSISENEEDWGSLDK